MKNIKIAFWFLSISLFVTACSDPVEMVPEPPSGNDLSFTYSVDAENPNLVHFVGQTTVDTWYVHWNFGDNTGAEELTASKVFFKAGEYEVRFKIFTEGGTASVSETLVIENDFAGPDLIENGSLDGDDAWTIFQIGAGVDVAIDGGVATWTGGSWGNAGLYQQVEIEADKEYQINMDISGGGMADCWFEIYVGQIQPQDGVDYTDGGILMALNTWEGCGSEDYDGLLTDVACVGSGGSFTWSEPGTAFFVIKSGGADLGPNGVTIDNIAIRSL